MGLTERKKTVLHVLPSFDVGGLGRLALTMIDAWPVGFHHLVVAPKYPATRPALLPEFQKPMQGLGNVTTLQVPRSLMASPPKYVNDLALTLRAAVINNVVPKEIVSCVHYNHVDLSWSMQAIRRVYSGVVLSHIGTVLDAGNADATGPFRSPFTREGVVFVPASYAVRDAAMVAMARCGEERPLAPVVWNGVDVDRFALADLRPDSAFTFCFTGRMAPGAKAWEFMFEAIELAHAAVTKKGKTFRVHIAGDGPLRKELEKKKHACVTLVGEVSDVPQFLHLADVFIMAALPIEGMSMALVEAIASGLPIVSTDVPSTREMLEPLGEFAFLSKTPAEMAEAMTKLVLDEYLLSNAELAVQNYRSRFEAATMVKRYLELGGWA